MVGMIPGVILYVYIGATTSDISSAEGDQSSSTKTVKTIFMVLGVIAGVGGVAVCSWYAKNEIENEIDGLSEEKNDVCDDSEIENEEKGVINKL